MENYETSAPVAEVYRRIRAGAGLAELRDAQAVVRDMLPDVSRARKAELVDALRDLRIAMGFARQRHVAAVQPRA